MIAYMRNVRTGEVRGVQLDSDEFDSMRGEVYDKGDGRGYPCWEQTGQHAVKRIDSGDVQVPEDLGDDFTPVDDITARGPLYPPDPHPERSLTAEERDAGIKSHEEKFEEPSSSMVEEGLKAVGSDGDSGDDAGDGYKTNRELREEARELGVTGYSTMTKPQLRSAIAEAEAGQEG